MGARGVATLARDPIGFGIGLRPSIATANRHPPQASGDPIRVVDGWSPIRRSRRGRHGFPQGAPAEGTAPLLQTSASVTLSARIALVLVVGSSLVAGCGVADAHPNDEVAMTGGGDERVLGKRAFDAASAGYPTFDRLATEAPQRTVVRARAQLAVLARDLTVLQSSGGADATEFGAAAALLADARVVVTELDEVFDAGRAIDDASLALLVAKVQGVQLALDGLRARRVRGA